MHQGARPGHGIKSYTHQLRESTEAEGAKDLAPRTTDRNHVLLRDACAISARSSAWAAAACVAVAFASASARAVADPLEMENNPTRLVPSWSLTESFRIHEDPNHASDVGMRSRLARRRALLIRPIFFLGLLDFDQSKKTMGKILLMVKMKRFSDFYQIDAEFGAISQGEGLQIRWSESKLSKSPTSI